MDSEGRFVKIIEDKLKDLITIRPTKKKYTFFLDFDWGDFYAMDLKFDYSDAQDLYHRLAEDLIKDMRFLGLSTARLKKRYLYNSYYYITFRSIHDVMAFKLMRS